MRTTAIIFNKSWELEPALAGMCSPEFCPTTLPFPEHLHNLKDRKYTSILPRAVFHFHRDGNPKEEVVYEVKVWCIQDMMNKSLSGSNSQEKFRVLPPILVEYNPELVIAVGTAGFPIDSPIAGCVVAGGRFFVHDGNPGNYSTHLDLPSFETLFPLNINSSIFGIINPSFKQIVEPKLVKPPINPAARLTLSSSVYFTTVSSLNVTDYGMYSWVDAQAVAALRQVEANLPIGSIETTHGLIRASSDCPCMFVSAITDSEGHFDMEVTNGQNYVAAFNSGIVLGHFIAGINNLLTASPTFSFHNSTTAGKQ